MKSKKHKGMKTYATAKCIRGKKQWEWIICLLQRKWNKYSKNKNRLTQFQVTEPRTPTEPKKISQSFHILVITWNHLMFRYRLLLIAENLVFFFFVFLRRWNSEQYPVRDDCNGQHPRSQLIVSNTKSYDEKIIK